MVDLTVVILTKNEEQNLRKCIESFRGYVKRFAIVDSYSTDGTEELCKQLAVELKRIGSGLDFYQNKWLGYSDQFNWGLTNANIKTEWTMRMDADEEIMESLAAEINEKLGHLDPSITGVIIQRRLVFMGRWIKHGGRYPEKLLRIFRTGTAECENRIQDAHLVLSKGKTVSFKSDLIDNNLKNIEWWTAKHNWYSNREVLEQQRLAENNADELADHGGGISTAQAKFKRIMKNSGYYRLPKFWRAHIYFIYRYYFKLGFLDGTEGRIFHFLQAYWYRYLVDVKMYECEKYGVKMAAQKDLQHVSTDISKHKIEATIID